MSPVGRRLANHPDTDAVTGERVAASGPDAAYRNSTRPTWPRCSRQWNPLGPPEQQRLRRPLPVNPRSLRLAPRTLLPTTHRFSGELLEHVQQHQRQSPLKPDRFCRSCFVSPAPATPTLTLGAFHDLLRRMAEARQIRLSPFTQAMYQLPEPEWALILSAARSCTMPNASEEPASAFSAAKRIRSMPSWCRTSRHTSFRAVPRGGAASASSPSSSAGRSTSIATPTIATRRQLHETRVLIVRGVRGSGKTHLLHVLRQRDTPTPELWVCPRYYDPGVSVPGVPADRAGADAAVVGGCRGAAAAAVVCPRAGPAAAGPGDCRAEPAGMAAMDAAARRGRAACGRAGRTVRHGGLLKPLRERRSRDGRAAPLAELVCRATGCRRGGRWRWRCGTSTIGMRHGRRRADAAGSAAGL